MRAVVAVGSPRADALAADLSREDVAVVAVVAPDAAEAAVARERQVDVLVLDVDPRTLTARLVSTCDARGVRIAPLCDTDAGRALAARFGLAVPLPPDIDGWALAEALRAPAAVPARAPERPAGGVIAVWGAHGAPGRTTLAIEMAAELCRDGRRVALVDADAHAPSVALALGLADEGPGFAAACRQAELGALDAAELERIGLEVRCAGGAMRVLTGINRPGRWPELSAARVTAVLAAARSWADTTVVDVAASLERDEEIVSDLDGPRRNAATLAALRAADRVVAVCAADPVGVARFLRGHAELRSVVGATPVSVVVNRLRAGTLGIDARGQVRRTLERFAGVAEVSFLPLDPRSADAALLSARAVADLAPRSPLAAAVRRFVGEVVAPPPAARTRSERARGERTRTRMRPLRVPRSA